MSDSFALPGHGIMAEFSKPQQSAASRALMGYLSPAIAPSSSRHEEDEATDYFAPRPHSRPSRSHTSTPAAGSSSWSHVPRSRTTSNDTVDEMSKLMEDVRSMTRGSASRWRKVATTMPRSLWKLEADSTTCDHLFFSGACDKEFGHFLAGKYRLPTGASSSNRSSENGPTSALWGSIKINRRNNCWRCGNCFCDDHSRDFATLILDAEDAPVKAPEHEDEEQQQQDEEQLQQLPAPVIRSATACLSQYLASEAAKASTSSSSRSNASSRVPTTAVGSVDSNTSAASSSLSGSSALAESLRHHGVARTSAACSPQMANDAVLSPAHIDDMDRQPEVALSRPRRANVAAALAAAMTASRATTTPAVSARMTILADGRYVVRERVCARCSNIVGQAKDRALAKQARRDQEAALSAAANADAHLAQPRRSSDPANRSLEDEDYHLSLQRLYEDYRRERRKLHAAARSNSADSVPRVPSFKLAPPPPRRYRRREMSAHQLDDESDESDDEEEHHHGGAHHHGHGHDGRLSPGAQHANVCAYFPVFPSRADFEDQHQVFSPAIPTPRAALPQCGMGGQRLKIALARYE